MDNVSEPSLAMSDSGVRRVGKRFLARLKHYLIPMAPRKHADEKERTDPTVIAWRSFLTAITAAIAAGTAYIIAHTGYPVQSDETTRNTLFRIEQQVSSMRQDVDQLKNQMLYVTAFIDGARKPTH